MIDELKEYLKITWNDEDINLSRILESGKIYLNNIVGISLDFKTNAYYKMLLFEYSRYVYNNALEYFDTNFRSQLVQLQIQNVVIEDVKK